MFQGSRVWNTVNHREWQKVWESLRQKEELLVQFITVKFTRRAAGSSTACKTSHFQGGYICAETLHRNQVEKI